MALCSDSEFVGLLGWLFGNAITKKNKPISTNRTKKDDVLQGGRKNTN
jgi:hypothetical protein